VPPETGNFRIEVGEDIAIDRHLEGDAAHSLAARRLNDELARHLGGETSHGTA